MVMESRRGVSLVEVEIAMVVLAIGLLATVVLVVRAGGILRAAAADQGAAVAAGEVIDSLVQHGRPSAGSLVRGRYTLVWTTTRDSAGVSCVVLTVRHHSIGGIRADTFTTWAAPWPKTIGHAP